MDGIHNGTASWRRNLLKVIILGRCVINVSWIAREQEYSKTTYAAESKEQEGFMNTMKLKKTKEFSCR